MQNPKSGASLEGKNVDARVLIARRVGACLSDDYIAAPDRRAAEILARALVEDAIERVRASLSVAVRQAKHLPRDLALKLAQDVDAVSYPFLQATDVFTDSDWAQLLQTISQKARLAVARRKNISEPMATVLVERGDSVVAEALVENSAAPMTRPICQVLLNRFPTNIAILDKLAARNDLLREIAIQLTGRVSTAVEEKLVSRYGLTDRDAVRSLVDDVELGAIIQIIKKTPDQDLAAMARDLQNENKLTPSLLLRILEEGHIAFLEAGFSLRAARRVEHVRSVIRRAGRAAVTQLLERADIPQDMQEMFHDGFTQARSLQPVGAP